MTDMEKLSKDKRHLRTTTVKQDVEMESLPAAKEKAEHATTTFQSEMASLKLEWKVATESLKNS
jgi:hypothetical protein